VIVDIKEVRKALVTAIEESVIKKEDKPDKVRKFDETVDLTINIRDVDIKNPNNRIDQEVMLPHSIAGNKRKAKVCFIVKDDMETYLRKNGYTVINTDQLDELQKQSNKDKKALAKKYEYFIARSDLMRDLAKVLARFLGQQGKMPRPQPKGFGVIRPDEDLASFLPNLEKIIRLDMKKQLSIQTKVAKKSQPMPEIMGNIEAVLNLVEHALPNGNNNIKSIYLKTTMSKPVKVAEAGRKGR
jgi:large subunit ribosomal protein L1